MVALGVDASDGSLSALQPTAALAGLALGLSGALLVLLDPRSVVGRILGWSAAVHGLAQIASAVASVADAPRTVLVAAAVGAWTWPFFVVPLLTLLPLVFPDHRLPGPRWRVWVWVSIGAIVLLCLASATAPRFELEQRLPDNPWAVPWMSAPTALLGTILWGLAAAAGLFAVALRWRRGDAGARLRLGLVAATLTVIVVGFALEPLLPDGLVEVTGTLSPVALVLALTVATVRHGLWAGELAMRRAQLYGLALCGLAVAYLVALAVFIRLLATAPAWLAAVLALVVTLGLLEPARRGAVRLVRRQLLGQEPLTALTRLREVTERADDPVAVLDAAVAQIAQSLRAPGARLVVRSLGDGPVTATAGTLGCDVLSVPLVHLAEDLGRLDIATRTPGERWSSTDRVLVDHLAAEAARTVSVLASRSELALLRTDRLTTYDDTRAQLGRDLHDTLGPVLAGTYLAAEALGLRLGPTTDEGERALGIARGVREANGQVRAMIERLQGADDLGGRTLSEAVTDRAREHATLDVTVDIDAGEPPADVARAAYLIIGEALTNCARHSGSPTAQVVVRRDDDDLVVQVRDEGTLGTFVAGVGVRSMRLRAAEAGGTMSIGPGSFGGTEVTARLPLEGR
jgi:signal transduction histidine kinase